MKERRITKLSYSFVQLLYSHIGQLFSTVSLSLINFSECCLEVCLILIK